MWSSDPENALGCVEGDEASAQLVEQLARQLIRPPEAGTAEAVDVRNG